MTLVDAPAFCEQWMSYDVMEDRIADENEDPYHPTSMKKALASSSATFGCGPMLIGFIRGIVIAFIRAVCLVVSAFLPEELEARPCHAQLAFQRGRGCVHVFSPLPTAFRIQLEDGHAQHH